MKETIEELLERKDMVNLERRDDNFKTMSFRKESELFETIKKLIPNEEQDKLFFLFYFDKGALVFLKAYSSIAEVIDDGWKRTDQN